MGFSEYLSFRRLSYQGKRLSFRRRLRTSPPDVDRGPAESIHRISPSVHATGEIQEELTTSCAPSGGAWG